MKTPRLVVAAVRIATAFCAVVGLHGCPPPPVTDAGDLDTGAVVDAATDSGVGIDCPAPGYTRLAADGATCFRAASCDNQPFCPALRVNDPASPAFILTQGDFRRPRVLNPTNAAGVVINQALVSGLIRWGLKFDLAAGTVQTGNLTQDALPQPEVGFYECGIL